MYIRYHRIINTEQYLYKYILYEFIMSNNNEIFLYHRNIIFYIGTVLDIERHYTQLLLQINHLMYNKTNN